MSDERLRNGGEDERGDSREDTRSSPRMKKDGTPDARYKRTLEANRQTREMASRAMTDARDEMSDDDRLMLLQSQALDNILPPVPEIPGFHLFWATTTSPSDPLNRRQALGYKFVTPDEMPGFAHLAVKSGEHAADRISCNEMVLMKIRKDLHLKYMTHLHHDKPQQQADSLYDQAEMPIKGRSGRPVSKISPEGEGLQREPAKAPDFSHIY
jgi:hypothetical protein